MVGLTMEDSVMNPNMQKNRLMNYKCNIQVKKSFFLVVSAILLASGLVACSTKHVHQDSHHSNQVTRNDTSSEFPKDLNEAIRIARNRGFVRCSVPADDSNTDYKQSRKDNLCLISEKQFTTESITTEVVSQRVGSLICCVTRISSQQTAQNCADFTPFAAILQNRCPVNWWKK